MQNPVLKTFSYPKQIVLQKEYLRSNWDRYTLANGFTEYKILSYTFKEYKLGLTQKDCNAGF